MNEIEDMIVVDATEEGSSSSRGDSSGVVDEKKEEFRSILKNTAMKKNVDNITESYMDGDITDPDVLVDLLEEHRVTPENVNVIFKRWFHRFPKEYGIDVFKRRRKENGYNEKGDEDDDIANVLKDSQKRESMSLARELNMLEAQKAKLSLSKQLKELSNDDSQKTNERTEPVMTVDNEGHVEIATDKEGNPVTRRIVEPIGSGSGGSSITDMIMLQKIIGNDRGNNSNDSLSAIEIQSLKSEIARLNERNTTESDRYRDRIADKDKEIASVRNSMSNSISNIKEEMGKEILRIKESHESEIRNIRERNEDKIDNIEKMNAAAIRASDERWQSREERIQDKLDQAESDFASSIEGLRQRHHEEVGRLHADYKQQLGVFALQSKSDLSSVETIHKLEVMHRDEKDADNKLHNESIKELERRIEEGKNMSVSEKQNAEILKTVSGGIGTAFETFGKPYVASMQTQQMVNQQSIAERASAQRQAKIDEMRRGGYSDEEIFYVVDGEAESPSKYDEAYEHVLNSEPEPRPDPEPEPEHRPTPQPEHRPTPQPEHRPTSFTMRTR